jgi:hypothetical protein
MAKKAENQSELVVKPANSPNSPNSVSYTDKRGTVATLHENIKRAFSNGTFRALGSGASLRQLVDQLEKGGEGMLGKFVANGETLERTDANGQTAFYLVGQFQFGKMKIAGRLTLGGVYDSNADSVRASNLPDMEAFEEVSKGEEFDCYASYRSDLPDGSPYIPAYPVV